jgi:hypothetical protein
VAAALAAGIAALSVTAPVGATESADQQIADDSVLTADDVPTVFHTSKVGDSREPAGKACLSIRKARKALRKATNKEVAFQTDPGQQGGALIDNKVAVFPSKKSAQAVLASYSTSSTDDCFTKTYQELFRDQLHDPKAKVDVSTSEYLPGLGDTSVGFDVRIDVSSHGKSNSFYVDLQLVRVKRAIDAFAFQNSGGKPPADDVSAMTRTGVTRLETAL